MPRAKQAPQRGDLVRVSWVDIREDPCGDPSEATLARRRSVGLFWESRQDEGIDVIVTTTTTEDDDVHDQSGYCIYPASCVTNIQVIKRAEKV